MNKRKGLITGIVIVVVLAVLTTVGIVLWNNKKSDDKASQTDTTLQQQTANDEIKYSGVEGKNALELLKESHQVEATAYEGMGEMVTSIDGKAADSAHFWSFYVNGEMATVGAGDYQTQNGDVIEWKLDEIK